MADIIAMFSRLAKSGLSEMFSQVSSFLDGSASSSMEPIQRSVMDVIQRINRILPRIEAVLEDAEEREVQDRSVKFWLSELRLLAYDIEDIVDEYEYEVLKARMESGAAEEVYHCGNRKRGYDDHHDGDEREEGRNLLVLSSSQVPTISDGMAEKLRKIPERFDEIERDRKALKLREEDGARRYVAPQRSRPTSSLVNESSIFGREGDKKKIMELLLSDSESSNNTVPIVGMGGVGKTTLAQLIYNDPEIRRHFDCRAWIYVSKSRQQINSWLEEASVLFVENLCVLDNDIDDLNTAEWPTFLLLGFYVCSSVHLKRISFSSDLIILKQLRIWNCPHLENFDGLNYLVSLQDMDISNCPNLYSTFAELPNRLQSLAIDRCNIFCLIFVGNDLSSLEISSCSTLETITFPQQGASLRFMKISSCPKLRLEDRSLPPVIPHLEIRACPQLQELCQKHRGTYFQD